MAVHDTFRFERQRGVNNRQINATLPCLDFIRRTDNVLLIGPPAPPARRNCPWAPPVERLDCGVTIKWIAGRRACRDQSARSTQGSAANPDAPLHKVRTSEFLSSRRRTFSDPQSFFRRRHCIISAYRWRLAYNSIVSRKTCRAQLPSTTPHAFGRAFDSAILCVVDPCQVQDFRALNAHSALGQCSQDIAPCCTFGDETREQGAHDRTIAA